jgi:Lysozyme inhibitor LprI
MKPATLLFASCCWLLISAWAQASGPQDDKDAIKTLLALSKLPEAELNEMLADCNADQQSMYFCAWRDKIVAERSLDRVAAEKKAAMPTCAAAIDEWIRTEWVRRDKACTKQASTNFSGGSLEPTARMTCTKDTTNKLKNKLAGIDDCRRVPSP